MKRGQLTQLFIMIATLLVIGATIFIGGKLIFGVSDTACKTSKISFQKELVSILDSHATYGSSDIVSLSSSCDIETICFVDSRIVQDKTWWDSFDNGNEKADSVIQTAIKNGVQSNIFVQPTKGATYDLGFDERIILTGVKTSPRQTELCIPAVSGIFTFRTEGYGRYILISEVS